MMRKLFVVIGILALTRHSVLLGQTNQSIQGVWRAVEVTITNPIPPRGNTHAKGTHTNVQPELLIFTAKHYSLMADLGVEPRPTSGGAARGESTLEELQGRWGPFNAHAGTYEVSGDTLTRYIVVAKEPALQRGKHFTRQLIKLSGNNLWLTQLETSAGKTANPVTVKYVRVE